MSNVLEVRGLTTEFKSKNGSLKIIENIDLTVKKGEILGIVGESGCGKSVTSLSILQLLDKKAKISSGSVTFNNSNLVDKTEKDMRKIRGNEISMIFQDPMTSLNPVLTIGIQIGEVIQKHQKLTGSNLKEKVVHLLKLVGIPRPEAIYHEYPHRLSGGMKQRVMIAMAISCNPSLLIADEPTTALDVTIQAQILALLKSLKDDLQMSILLITHDLGVVAEMCDRVVVMYAGQVVETTDTRTLLRNPRHPYTIGLIQSTPHQSKGENRLKSIPGQVPTPDNYPKGCRFADRCPKVLGICRTSLPPLIEVDDQTSCRCWLLQQKETFV
ncbi:MULTISPECIES: ABC transporter ATP-binding protein [unclassified Bacillus (in: firmicutes)]|uniref:ABC transporter ATP-binding protein n=1 Tax=unclassified Bacillus (in: firmicutes) TaxID=185979 RepID=UPI000BF1AC82|nr:MULTISPECIES: ABC transporter ATP-binding protein [unclassified Bacillus (in: firmicutes)]PEJ53837.1 peptide ABC transporter ATP-binding protein [Bacillus sp. AFS002410]PEL11427.1 peptide ABC transporter ATP-binding protein [Bacillus sp. AFS017336]